MKQKEKWAEEAKWQYAKAEDNLYIHDYHDDHYKIGWVAGFEWCKKQIALELARVTDDDRQEFVLKIGETDAD